MKPSTVAVAKAIAVAHSKADQNAKAFADSYREIKAKLYQAVEIYLAGGDAVPLLNDACNAEFELTLNCDASSSLVEALGLDEAVSEYFENSFAKANDQEEPE